MDRRKTKKLAGRRPWRYPLPAGVDDSDAAVVPDVAGTNYVGGHRTQLGDDDAGTAAGKTGDGDCDGR